MSKFDGKHKMYFGETEIPLVIRQEEWLWDKFDFDIQKFEVVDDGEEEE
jgi:hypothetical protein